MLVVQNGYTPLHIAAKKNQMDIATTLLECSAKPDAESRVGDYPNQGRSQKVTGSQNTLNITNGAFGHHLILGLGNVLLR